MTTGQDEQGFHERAQALLLQAVEQPEDQRAAWLERACGGDRRLAAEVASLLRHHRPQRTLVAPGGAPGLLVVRDVSAPAWTRPRRLLLAALALLAALGVGGVMVQLQVRAALRHSLEDHLVSVRQAGVTGLEIWMREVMLDAESIATDADVAQQVLAVVQGGAAAGEAEVAGEALRRRLDAVCLRHGWLGWGLVRLPGTQVLAVGGPQATRRDVLGRPLTPEAHALFARLSQTTTPDSLVLPPHARGSFLEGDPGGGPPVVTLAAAIRHQGESVAALVFQIPPEQAFTRILGQTGAGQGETVAFDAAGRLLSHSAYEDALRAAGRLGGASAMLNLVLHDPGVDLLAGETPDEPLDSRPLTEAVRRAIAGGKGELVERPYRSYAGQMVVGAWTWLHDHDFGVVTEIPVGQAYAPLLPWRHVLIGLWSLLAVVALAVVVLSVALGRLRERVEQIAELGQYTLDRPLGAGGMGTVYLARHALLRRPTAVKVLAPERASDDLVRRFEQEVQQTALLSHPNTIEIYDYGRTPDRVFYYAMEYAEGLTLERLVELEGRLPPARAVHLLRQLCGSLAEAHARGLVHRDVKPPNVLVCERGGLPDFVKVLDFGLVKSIAAPGTCAPDSPPPEQTSPELLLGTLLYLPPERLRGETAADARADVYAVGATAFKLLTGRDAFSGATTAELCANILDQPVPRPSACGAPGVPAALDALVMSCLAKSPEQRPAHAGALVAALDALAGELAWTEAEARAWWRRRAAGEGRPAAAASRET